VKAPWFRSLPKPHYNPKIGDIAFLRHMKTFLDEYQFTLYTERLGFYSDENHLYDPYLIPFTEEAVRYIVEQI
jgi:uncharacterized protein (UPF0276 family)